MAVRDLCFEGAPVLTRVAMPINRFDDDLSVLVRDLFDTMYDAFGRGIAAPQVGVPRRVFVVDTDWKERDPAPMCFVNPRIIAQSDRMVDGQEACLSIPQKNFHVPRPQWVELKWVDLDGAPHKGRFEDVHAVCVCHELDHLDGILISQSGVLA